jgi:hypothetical protein
MEQDFLHHKIMVALVVQAVAVVQLTAQLPV